MSFFTSLATGALVSSLWKFAAIAMFAISLGSSGYFAYQLHEAHSELKTANANLVILKGERDAALVTVGELKGAIAIQNKSIEALGKAKLEADAKYDAAMKRLAPLNRKLDDLTKRLQAAPKSTTCDQALSKQREAIEGLRVIQEVP
jgi:uncharacterized coiled-coil protein SlyX